jgi:hypothetical protein
MKVRMMAPQLHQAVREFQERLLAVGKIPVVPTGRVILSVTIIVAVLCAADFVAPADHGYALRAQQREQKIALLPLAQGNDFGVVGPSLRAAIPGVIVVGPVAVLFSIGVVVLVVVADQVVEREPIVRGDEIDAGGGMAAVPLVEVARTREAIAELGELPVVALPVPPRHVAVAAVPLGPQRRKFSHLVTAFANVPGLGDELDLRDHRILVDDVEEGREAVDLMQFPGQRGGQVEAEAVHVHLLHPVTQAVHHQLQHLGMAHVQRIAGARVIHVIALLVGDEAIVCGVVDALEAERRPHLVALAGVIVDHVQNHLDSRPMQRFHHLFEFADLLAAVARRRIARLRGKEIDGVIPPIVAQAAIEQSLVVDELVDRHQLYRGNAQLFEVLDDHRVPQARVGAAQFLRYFRVGGCETLHMEFVNHGIVQRRKRRPVVLPIEVRGSHHALRDSPSIVGIVV